MYLSVVEASSQRFRILLRVITRNVKQRMTKENMNPFAKRIPITQPAFWTLFMPSMFTKILLIHFLSGGCCTAQAT